MVETYTSLRLSEFASEINDELICELGHFCGSNVRELDLSGCTKIKRTGVRMLSHVIGEELRSLTLSRVRLDDDVAKILFNGLVCLETLDLSHCSRITSITARTVSTACRNSLVRLDLSHCPHITDEAMFWIAG